MTTGYLFDLLNPTPDNPTPHQVERERLSAQCQRILARLERGPVANTELATLALKYTGRISDLRAAGHDVEAYNRDRRTGVCWYRLTSREA